jgi:hypothetical protein
VSEACVGTPATWSAGTFYKGIDGENYAIAKFVLNQYANTHRTILFETSNLVYAKFEIGDIIKMTNCPFSLMGTDIYGFGGSTAWTATLNGQTIYGAFVITSVKRDIKRITIEAMQCHKLDSYEPVRIKIRGGDF